MTILSILSQYCELVHYNQQQEHICAEGRGGNMEQLFGKCLRISKVHQKVKHKHQNKTHKQTRSEIQPINIL